MIQRTSIDDILQRKSNHQKITMLTAYDYPMAKLMDEAGIDILLVGDSLAQVVLGLDSTKEVGMFEMIHHAKAVVRAAKKSLIVGDMPYCAYQPNPEIAFENAKQFMSVGCHAVKLEWFEGCAGIVSRLVSQNIPVMGHVGLTPQTAQTMSVQGKDAKNARRIMEEAKIFQKAGCFALVLECIPTELARLMTNQLTIPTIGIGAGPYCDGQVLVSYDVLGLISRYQPKFTKKYIDLTPLLQEAFKSYVNDVQSGSFPSDAHSFHMPTEEYNKLN